MSNFVISFGKSILVLMVISFFLRMIAAYFGVVEYDTLANFFGFVYGILTVYVFQYFDKEGE